MRLGLRAIAFTLALFAAMACVSTDCMGAATVPSSSRLRVGIISFTGSFNYQYVQYAANCLSDALVGMGRFEVIEREHIQRILSEQRFQVSGAVNPDTAVRLGEILGIDYTFIGSLDRCSAKSDYWTDKDGKRHYYYSGSAEVSIRIVDASTGAILSSFRLTGSGTDSSSTSSACMNAIRSCFDSSFQSRLATAFPVIARVLEYRGKDEVYIFTDESSVISKGSDFRILRPNVAEVGEPGFEHRFMSSDEVAIVRIVSVYGTVGKGKVVKSSGEIMAGDYAVELQGYATAGEVIAGIIGIAGLIVLILLASMLEQ
ncbi:MAG: CsgG/HfaB family protein [Firmicutes bacterium]|nr:CsgG/HfaB family protein [Bacillota bacterium]